jgi:hypothetical protein
LSNRSENPAGASAILENYRLISPQSASARKDWILVWNMALENGGLLAGGDIEISTELEHKRVLVPEVELAATV